MHDVRRQAGVFGMSWVIRATRTEVPAWGRGFGEFEASLLPYAVLLVVLDLSFLSYRSRGL